MINQEIVLKNCIDYVKDYVGNDYTYAYPSDKFFKKRHYPSVNSVVPGVCSKHMPLLNHFRFCPIW